MPAAVVAYDKGICLYPPQHSKPPSTNQSMYDTAAVECGCCRFKAASGSVRELILMMMHDDPRKRPTARQVLQHRWLKGGAASPDRLPMDAQVRRRMLQLTNLR